MANVCASFGHRLCLRIGLTVGHPVRAVTVLILAVATVPICGTRGGPLGWIARTIAYWATDDPEGTRPDRTMIPNTTEEIDDTLGGRPEVIQRTSTRRVLLRAAIAGGLVASSGCLTADPSTPGHDGRDDGSIRENALEVGLDARSSVLKVGNGTGWIVDDGFVVTCSHVVDDDVVEVETFDGRRSEGSVVERHDDVDLAFVATETDDLEPLALEMESGAVDRPVVKVGHPDAVGSWIVSVGHVIRSSGDELIADVPCGPGDSGSPLLTLDGMAIGHVTGSTVLVEERAGLERPETLIQDYEGQRHVSRAHAVESVRGFLQ